MSGTSMDGVDGVLVDFSQTKPLVIQSKSASLAIELRAELLALNTSGADELHRAMLAANALARTYAQVVQALLTNSGIVASQVAAVGAHGQTLRHRPQMFDQTGYTLQLNNPALLAELTGINVVADFRSRDVAAGGQGAPLAPFFHQAWFAQHDKTVGVLNIGGISNLTVLSAQGNVVGFDCGPGNALMDMWCQQHTSAAFDRGGAWAAGGQCDQALLHAMLREPYFALPPPKSTGRDLFNRAWLDIQLRSFSTANPQDIQSTLTELAAKACITSVSSYEISSKIKLDTIIVCGGGAYNTTLMQRLQAMAGNTPVVSSDAHGLPPLQVEATAFAWLAKQTMERTALPLSSVTGAQGARVLGCLYPA
jgi:anhydro-N-acetylmuramic acid kinase